VVVIAGALKTAVYVLLSSEYPVALTCCPEQRDVNAERLNGEITWLLLTGVLTITPANEGIVIELNMKTAISSFFEILISSFCTRKWFYLIDPDRSTFTPAVLPFAQNAPFLSRHKKV
jgi:hypothetical protein